MARKEKQYRRLPGRGAPAWGLAGTSSLWMAKDHLLYVSSSGYAERYKRFYYENIQAFVIRKTVAGKVVNILVGAIAAMALVPVLIGIIGEMNEGTMIFFGVVAAVFGVVLLGNWARGSTCATFIHTGVQAERIYSIGRFYIAMKVLRKVRPLIEEAQGTLDTEGVEVARAEWTRAAESEKTTQSPLAARATVVVKKYYGGVFHLLLFLFILADVWRVALMFYYTSIVLVILGLVGIAGILLWLMLSLAMHRRATIASDVKASTWAAFGYLVLGQILGYVRTLIAVLQNDLSVQDRAASLGVWIGNSMGDKSLFFTVLPVMAAGLFVGVFGLVATVRYRRRATTPPPIPIDSPSPDVIQDNAD
jgi:hypothetical protein